MNLQIQKIKLGGIKMSRLYLVAGHGAGDPGAVGNGYNEADVTRKIANRLYDLCKNRVTTSLYPTSKNLYQSQDYSIFPADSEVVEIHLNAGGGNGTEVWIKQGYTADTVDNAIKDALGTFFTQRGIKYSSSLANMNNFASRGISYRLIEVCFIDNASNMSYLMNNFEAIMKKLADNIVTAMGGSSGGGSDTLYRVRLTWADAASQKGAFTTYANAVACANANPGYSVFDASGNKLYASGSSVSYVVRITTDVLNVRAEPNTSSTIVGTVYKGEAYTIVQEQNGFGKLKSGLGWISLEYTEKV